MKHPNATRLRARSHPGSEAPAYPDVVERMLHFDSFSMAVEIGLYNAVLLCLLGLLFSQLAVQGAQMRIDLIAVEIRRSRDSPANTGLTIPLPGTISMHSAALEIVRSFEYQLAHIHHNTSTPTLFWLFPLGLASKVLRKDQAMKAWIQQMLGRSEVTREYGRGDNAFGFGFYELPDVQGQG